MADNNMYSGGFFNPSSSSATNPSPYGATPYMRPGHLPSNATPSYAMQQQQQQPQQQYTGSSSSTTMTSSSSSVSNDSNGLFADDDYSNEPPLLEELGVNFSHIKSKVIAVMMIHKSIEPNLMNDSDMAGPLVFCLALGSFLLLTGKLHFGYIYGFGMLGCLSIYCLMNLMTNDMSKTIDFTRTFSVLGYSLLPIVILSAISVIIDLKGFFGTVCGIISIFWCTIASARIFEVTLGLSQHRWLIAYPTLLFYACFALITIF